MSDPKDKSIGELLGDLMREVEMLVRQEMQLAKTEITAKIGASIRDAAMLIVAATLGFVGFQAFVVAAILGLSHWVTPWLAALIIGAVLVIVAGILALIGAMSLKKSAVPVPEQTVETLKEDIQWAKQQMKS